MNNVNILIGGKLGDFLLGVYGGYLLCKYKNIKINIYMVDIGWEFGIEKTYESLYSIIMAQPYVNDFQILTDYYLNPIQIPSQHEPIKVFNKKLIEEGYIVDDYLSSPLLYKACWTDIYSNMYNVKPTINDVWLTFDKIDFNFKKSVVIHRRFNPERMNVEFPYQQIIDTYDSIFFISFDENDYSQFEWKKNINFIKVENLIQWFTIINSCALYVGNLTGPTVIAHGLNKLRIIELPNVVDAYHWIGEEKYSTNMKWFLNDKLHNLK